MPKKNFLGSSNANENLNQVIAKKALKSQQYFGSDSLSLRVAAAIAQKNEGHSFIVEVIPITKVMSTI